MSMNAVKEIKTWGSLVKFSHSIFALPFAASMAMIIQRDRSLTIREILLLLICIVTARTAAMAFNRLVDRDIDKENPRTVMRELPQGIVSVGSVRALIVISSSLFIFAASMLGNLPFALSPLVLILLFAYSYTKRFTHFSHIVLGFCLSIAPGGVWIALQNQWSWIPVPLMVAVICWVAGFDILYSCQDKDFDQSQRLFSVPSRFGIENALKISKALHALSIGALLVFGSIAHLGPIYLCGVGIFAYLLWNQHSIVESEGLSRIDAVFFSRNGLASVLLFLFVSLDCLVPYFQS